jgi:hypothetical protein
LIPLQVKKMVTVEIMRFPPLIRRELLSNALANGGVDRPTKDFIRHAISMHLPKGQLLEIELLEAVKERRITAQEIENTLNRASMAASYSGVSGRA